MVYTRGFRASLAAHVETELSRSRPGRIPRPFSSIRTAGMRVVDTTLGCSNRGRNDTTESGNGRKMHYGRWSDIGLAQMSWVICLEQGGLVKLIIYLFRNTL